MRDQPWYRDWVLADPAKPPARLSRDEFVAEYFPRYVEPYRAPTGIRLRPNGRMMTSSPGSVRAQQTKRHNRVETAYAAYVEGYGSCFASAQSELEVATPEQPTAARAAI